MTNRIGSWLLILYVVSGASARDADLDNSDLKPNNDLNHNSDLNQIVVSATRLLIPAERSPSATTVITGDEIDQRQYRFATDALQTVPGLNIVQTGTPGQVTSAFIRGLRSDQTQVLLDGIPINQGLAGFFNFADQTTDDIDRIEVIRGPQSAVYGSRASAGVINFITRRGTNTPTGGGYFEGGSYNSFRGGVAASGAFGPLDFSLGASRYDTENARQNNGYRANSVTGDFGLTPLRSLRIGLVFTYTYADVGSPNTIFNPQPYDNLRTERWLVAPNIEFKPVEWWKNRFYFSYDQERQINNPNRVDPFTGPTRGVFRRSQLEYQNDLSPLSWVSLTSGFYYSHVNVYQERPGILFGDPLIRDKSENIAGYGQLKVTPIRNLDLYGGIRYDAFRDFGDRLTYRIAGNYLFAPTQTILRSSFATGFTPPSSQDKIFGGNPDLKPDRDKGFDIGLEQSLWGKRVQLGGNYFYNTASNVVGFNSQFQAFNLGGSRSQGIELYAFVNPIAGLIINAAYTYLDAVNTSGQDFSQPPGGRLARRPRNTFYLSVAYLWWQRLLTTVEVRSVNARQDISFNANNMAFNVPLEDYTVVRLSAEYRIRDWLKVTGRIDNLFDEKYAEVAGYPSLGRTFYGGFELRF
jgi:vitamin B12 transporter